MASVHHLLYGSDGRVAMGWCHRVAGRAIAIFQPTIITSFGYTNIDAILFGIPIHTVGIIWGVLLAFIADRYQHRTLLICLNIVVGTAGMALAGFDLTSRNVRLAGLFLGSMGISADVPG